jgi:hypothetical protein
MTPDETKQAAAVMIAFAEGKKIEYKVRCGARGWEALKLDEEDGVDWDWETYEFRIAPEPMEIEVWVHDDGRVCSRGEMREINAVAGRWTLRRATIHPEEVKS